MSFSLVKKEKKKKTPSSSSRKSPTPAAIAFSTLPRCPSRSSTRSRRACPTRPVETFRRHRLGPHTPVSPDPHSKCFGGYARSPLKRNKTNKQKSKRHGRENRGEAVNNVPPPSLSRPKTESGRDRRKAYRVPHPIGQGTLISKVKTGRTNTRDGAHVQRRGHQPQRAVATFNTSRVAAKMWSTMAITTTITGYSTIPLSIIGQ